MSKKFKYNRSEYIVPAVLLEHIDLFLSFYEDRVEGVETLSLTPRKPLSEVCLDAAVADFNGAELEIGGGSTGSNLVSLTALYEKKLARLTIMLPREYAAGETLRLRLRAVCRPDGKLLDGLYRDVTPPGAPQQYISQCQQWGFQRIMPIIDDCTAKCTWRTTLEGSSRYTHLISNGDISRADNPDGTPVPAPNNPERMRITYINNIPMPPYLFIAAAGTWDVLARDIITRTGRRVRLEYLTPPGRANDAEIPMDILESSVLWQSKELEYEYRRDCYRTICMEKSNFGGMENAGNTTVVTDSALIDKWTTDRRLVYAHGVIVHEYEHNHCGGDVTMLSPFDMWLNEAYTVDIERRYLAHVFGYEETRLDEIGEIRDPLDGPLATEETGSGGQIVREGFNNPDDVVDGTTYVKAPEVLGMLRRLVGAQAYDCATREYFSRFNGGNASTDDFISVFMETCPDRASLLDQFFREWLFTTGYPEARCSYDWDRNAKLLRVKIRQIRHGAHDRPFVFPFAVSAFDKKGGLLASGETIVDKPEIEFDIGGVSVLPAFVDWNGGAPFYGTVSESDATEEKLAAAVLNAPSGISKAEAAGRLTNIQMAKAVRNPAFTPSRLWLDLFPAILADKNLSDGIKARLLTVSENMLDGAFLPLAPERRRAADMLRRAAALRCGCDALENALRMIYPTARELEPVHADLPVLIPRRRLRRAILRLAASAGDGTAVIAERFFHDASNITDRLNSAEILCLAGAPGRTKIMRELFEDCRGHIAAYGAYLRIAAASPAPDVFADIARERTNPAFDITHPTHSRSLYCGFAANNNALWTDEGLRLASDAIVELSRINENTAVRMFSPFRFARSMSDAYRDKVTAAVASVWKRIDPELTPSLAAEIHKSIDCAASVND